MPRTGVVRSQRDEERRSARRDERPREKLGPRPVRRPCSLRRVLGLGRRLFGRGLRSGCDPRPPCARGHEHSGVLHRGGTRWRHARRQATEERERIHVDRDGAVGVGALERDTHEAVGPRLEPLLRERRTKHVARELPSESKGPREWRTRPDPRSPSHDDFARQESPANAQHRKPVVALPAREPSGVFDQARAASAPVLRPGLGGDGLGLAVAFVPRERLHRSRVRRAPEGKAHRELEREVLFTRRRRAAGCRAACLTSLRSADVARNLGCAGAHAPPNEAPRRKRGRPRARLLRQHAFASGRAPLHRGVVERFSSSGTTPIPPSASCAAITPLPVPTSGYLVVDMLPEPTRYATAGAAVVKTTATVAAGTGASSRSFSKSRHLPRPCRSTKTCVSTTRKAEGHRQRSGPRRHDPRCRHRTELRLYVALVCGSEGGMVALYVHWEAGKPTAGATLPVEISLLR